MDNKDLSYEVESPYKVEPHIKTVDISKIPFDLDLKLDRVDIVIEDTRYIGSANINLSVNNLASKTTPSSAESDHDNSPGDHHG